MQKKQTTTIFKRKPFVTLKNNKNINMNEDHTQLSHITELTTQKNNPTTAAHDTISKLKYMHRK